MNVYANGGVNVGMHMCVNVYAYVGVDVDMDLK